MLLTRITRLDISKSRLLFPSFICAHTKTCPAAKKPMAVCPGSGGDKSSTKLPVTKRKEKSDPCRLGFVPEEWFRFFHSKTGVSGPYVFGIVLTNYLISKEIYIMEHEYYLGLSMIIVMYNLITKLGPQIGASLDKEVDAISKEIEKGRLDALKASKQLIDEAKDAQWRAEGQSELIAAKKENIAMQLEAAYRERIMHVYNTVKGRMDYQLKKYNMENRIHQKWMVDWILQNVKKSITPELQKQALISAISELKSISAQASK